MNLPPLFPPDPTDPTDAARGPAATGSPDRRVTSTDGLAFGAVIPLRTVVMGDAFGGPRFGTLMGIQAAAIGVGRAAGPAVVGWIGGDVRGSRSPWRSSPRRWY